MGSFDGYRDPVGTDRGDPRDGHRDGRRKPPDSDVSHGRDHACRTPVGDGSQTRADAGRTDVRPRTNDDRLRTDGGESSDDGAAPPPPALFAHEANDLVEFWSEYPLDFTPESLRHLDSLVGEHWHGDQYDEVESGVKRGMVVQFGSYFGETLVRHCDGEWVELDPGSWAVTVRDEEGEATVDVFRVARECLQGNDRFFGTYETVAGEI